MAALLQCIYVFLNKYLVLVFSRQANNNQNKPGFLKKNQYTNTKLEVRKIPPEMNNITQLNEHFSKFGTIVNIQVKNKVRFYFCMWVFYFPWSLLEYSSHTLFLRNLSGD